MEKKVLGFIFLLLWNGAVMATAAEERLHVGILDLPPLYEVGPEGRPGGILLELLSRILDEAGFSYDVAVYPPRRLYWNIAHGRCHVFLGVKGVPELEGRVIYGKKRVTEIDLRVYTLDGENVPVQKEDLYGKRVIVIRGYCYGGLIRELEKSEHGVELMEASDHVHAFRQLEAGRGDYLLDYSLAADYAIRALKMEGQVRDGLLCRIGVFLKVSREVPDAEGLMSRLEAAWEDVGRYDFPVH